MKKNGYADTTIEATGKRLRHLQKHCNLKEPEEVKGYIANKQCSNAYKESLIETYAILMKSTNQKWKQPFYKRYDKLPKIPTEQKISMLISNARTRMALFLSMSKELGTRPIELTWLKIKDINLENGIVNITSAKHCIGRALKLKTNTLEMLKKIHQHKTLKPKRQTIPNQIRKHKHNRSQTQKRTSRKTPRPNNTTDTTIRFQTLLRNHAIPQNKRPTTR